MIVLYGFTSAFYRVSTVHYIQAIRVYAYRVNSKKPKPDMLPSEPDGLITIEARTPYNAEYRHLLFSIKKKNKIAPSNLLSIGGMSAVDHVDDKLSSLGNSNVNVVKEPTVKLVRGKYYNMFMISFV